MAAEGVREAAEASTSTSASAAVAVGPRAASRAAMPARGPAARGTLLPTQRMCAAAGAAVAAAVVTNPFDVVKTRMQAQAAVRSVLAAGSLSTSAVGAVGSLAIEGCGCAGVGTPRPDCAAEDCGVFRNALDAMKKITRREGVKSLWRGTPTALAMAVPQVGIYMPMYEFLKAKMRDLGPEGSAANGTGAIPALVAGSTARTLAVLATSPLELVRTRQQAASAGAPSRGGFFKQVAREVRKHRGSTLRAVPQLWSGTVATLARDVPFSGIYWVAAEHIRGRVGRVLGVRGGGKDVGSTVAVNLAAGVGAGALAAAVTTPLDVVKTRVQIQLGQGAGTGPGYVTRMAGQIAREEGVRQLFAGMVPRAARAAPSCAIVLASYEVLKHVLGVEEKDM